MKLIIDTNIVFSSFLKKDSKELNIIESGKHDIYFCQFTSIELFKHKEKIVKSSGLTEEEIIESYQLLLKNINMIHERDIPNEIVKYSYQLCKDIDESDTIFVASSIFIDAYLWTGDKKLMKGLNKKGFNKVILTKDIE